MLKRFYLFIALLCALSSCSFDDTLIWDKLNDHERRIKELELLCDKMNTNVVALQSIVSALQNNDYVTDVTQLTENGIEVGYTITFSKSGKVTIFHGEDGEDGNDGINGKDGKTLVIGVKQDTDGAYYWTINSEWLTDQNGNKIPTTGKNGADGEDGEDGKNGVNGKDGITPKLKIEGGYWYLSYDEGQSWVQLGKAVGKDGDSFLQDITEDGKCVYVTLANGTCLTVPKYIELNIEFDKSDLTEVKINTELRVGYYISSNSPSVQIEVMPSNDLRAEVIADDSSNKTGEILIRTGNDFDSASKVLVFVTDNNKVIMKSIALTVINESDAAQLYVYNGDTKNANHTGGVVTLSFLTNVDCRANIPEEAKSWISVADVKSLSLNHIQLNIAENTSERRSAVVKVESIDGKLSLEYTIVQAGRSSSSTPSIDNEGTIVGKPAANEIFYTSTDGKIISPGQSGFDAVIVSNNYDNGVGVITFDRQVTIVGGFSYQDKLKEIILPEGVKEIKESAFNSCSSLININIPNTVESIGKEAFYSASSSFRVPIETIFIPSSVKNIGYDAFRWCDKLKSVHISDLKAWCSIICGIGVNYISGASPTCNGADLYLNGELVTEVVVPDGLNTVGNFAGCNSITKVIIPEGVTEIRNSAFYACSNLTEISLPESLTTIDSRAFCGCASLSEVELPQSLTNIDTYAFYGCKSLRSIEIPDKVKVLYGYTFGNCTLLQKVTFGKAFKTYRESEFTNNYYLNEVYFKSQVPPSHYTAKSTTLFGALGVDVTIYVPNESLDAYKEAPAFSNCATKIVGQ